MYLTNQQIHNAVYQAKDNPVCFWRKSDKYGIFSNFSLLPLGVLLEHEVGAVPIRTSEHLYQALKFPNHPNIQHTILDQRTPNAAADLGRNQGWADKMRPDWNEVRASVMDWVVRYKWLTHQGLIGRDLKGTLNRRIVETSPIDDYWGCQAQRGSYNLHRLQHSGSNLGTGQGRVPLVRVHRSSKVHLVHSS